MRPDTDIKGSESDQEGMFAEPFPDSLMLDEENALVINPQTVGKATISDVGVLVYMHKFQSNPQMNALKIHGLDISFKGFSHIYDAIRAKKNVISLSVINSKIDVAENFAFLCAAIQLAPLKSLELDLHTLRKDFSSIADACSYSKTLTSVYFDRFTITQSNFADFTEILKNSKTIVSLKMSRFQIQEDSHIQPFFDAIKDSHILTTVSLDFSSMKFEPDCFTRAATIVKSNKSIKDIALKNYISVVDGFEVLAEALKGNTTLNSIDLSGCHLGTRTKNIVDIISENITLTRIALNDCAINDDDALKIAAALEGNFSLTALEISQTEKPISQEILDIINGYLERNQKLIAQGSKDRITKEAPRRLLPDDKSDAKGSSGDSSPLLSDKKERESVQAQKDSESQTDLVRQLIEQNETFAAQVKILQEQLQLATAQRDLATEERDALIKEKRQKDQQDKQLKKVQEKFFDPKKIRASGLFKKHLKDLIEVNCDFESSAELGQFIEIILSDAVVKDDLQNVLLLRSDDERYQKSKLELLKDDPQDFMKSLIDSIYTVKKYIADGSVKLGAVVDEYVLTFETLMELMTELQQEKNPQLPDAKGGSKAEARSSSSSSSNPSLKKPSPTPGATSGNPYMAKGQVSKGKK